ncbi:FAD-dependent thymidylate synthase [Salinispira pacifica]
MAHCVVPAAEEVLDREFRVLDKGFVRLVDYLGSDERIVQAARVSYGEGTKSFRQDRGLIDYLLRNQHTSPFEQVVLTFHAKMPIFVARQWVRHRMARLNEISGRYSILKDEFYIPEGSAVALQSEDNKQGRREEPVEAGLQERIRSSLERQQQAAYAAYSELLELGLARELARINLPVSAYTEWYWQIDLHNLFHFLQLRMDPHAQFEIREYARTIHQLAARVCPLACESFDEHIAGGVRLSRSEMGALSALLERGEVSDEQLREQAEAAGLKTRAQERFISKLRGRHVS